MPGACRRNSVNQKQLSFSHMLRERSHPSDSWDLIPPWIPAFTGMSGPILLP